MRQIMNTIEENLDRAQRLLDGNEPKKALTLLQTFYSEREGLQMPVRLALLRLLSFASFQTEAFEDVERYASEGRETLPESLDFYFISAINCARTKKYDKAGEFSEKYLSLLEQKSKNLDQDQGFDGTARLKHQVLSAFGAVLCESKEFKRAESILREAIDLKPGFDSSYVNLAIALKAQNRTDESLAVIREGLDTNPHSEKLKKMIEWSGKRTTVSACMIVKDEEELLPRCLKSIVDVVDEIILVDTGSKDRTVEIAEEFGCKIYHFPWQGDFSSARNESMRYATKDWIFIIDADEEFPAKETHKLRVVTNQDELEIISISCLNKSLETGQVTSFLPSVRLVRRELGLQYFGIVHNRLDIPREKKVLRADIELFHYGYDLSREKMDNKLDRTRELLNRQLHDNPNDVYANFNMAQLLRGYTDGTGPDKSRLIVKHATRVIENPESKEKNYYGQRLMAYHQKAIGLCSLQEFDEAEQCCLEALSEKEDYLDPILTLGDIYNYKTDFVLAQEYYEKYLALQAKYQTGEEITNIILHNLDARHKAWYGLGLVGERTGNTEKAIDAYEHVLKNHSPYLDTYIRIARVLMTVNRHEEAIAYFDKEITENGSSDIAYYGLGCALAGLKQYPKAIEALRTAVQLMPGNADRRYTLGKVLLDSGDTAKGEACILEAADLYSDNAELFYDAGNILFTQGDYEKALEMYNNALAKNPNHVQARLNLGNCCFKTGHFDSACSIYEQVIAIDSTIYAVYRNLGIALARLDRVEEALNRLMTYSENRSDDMSVYPVMGELFVKAGHAPEAIGCYEKYLISKPKDVSVIVGLADIYLGMGRVEAAITGYRQAIKVNPDYEPAQARLKELLKSQTV